MGNRGSGLTMGLSLTLVTFPGDAKTYFQCFKTIMVNTYICSYLPLTDNGMVHVNYKTNFINLYISSICLNYSF